MRKIGILQVNSSKFYGGGEVHLKGLALELKNRGHNVVVAIREEILGEFKGLDLQLETLGLKNVIDLFSIFKLVKIIKKEEIDIIHLHSGKDYWLGIIAAILARRGKVVITRHILSSLGKSYLHRKLYKKVSKFIAVSTEVKSILNRENNLALQDIEVIHNWVDLDRFNPKKVESQDLRSQLGIGNELILTVIGRLAREKNQELLIKVAKDLSSKGYDFKYLIVGRDNSSKKEYREVLKTLIRRYSLEDKVILTGFRKDIPELIDISDIVVIPSNKEAFGLVAVEAMAMGKAVVASRVGGLTEVIEDDVNGMLFEKGDRKDLRKMIVELTSEEKRAFIGDNAYSMVVERFRKEVPINRVEELYSKLV